MDDVDASVDVASGSESSENKVPARVNSMELGENTLINHETNKK
jgi:hypothetical protein